MAAVPTGAILRHIHRLVETRSSDHLTDGQLLQRFTQRREGEAFTALMRRHGRMVWGVCRHVLHREHDAEDAFQAAFLVLARRAASIRKTESLGSWLHGVAFRIAMNARRSAAKREEREHRAAAARSDSDPPPDLAWRELQAILDEELQHLPEKYRSPFILCCLEGRSRAEAATELGWKEGTLSSRIAQARALLQERLTRRGVMLSAALTAGVMWNQPASAALMQTTQKAATLVAAGRTVSAAVTPTVTTLVKSAAGMAGVKSKIAIFVVLVGIIGGTLGVASSRQPATTVQESKSEAKAQTALPRAEGPALKTDAFGDPLPPGALVRMGTIRFRQPYPLVVFSADGKSLSSAGADNTLHTWDVPTGKYLRGRQLEGAADLDLSAISLAPDGKALLLWRASRLSLSLHEVDTGKRLAKLSVSDMPHRAAVSPGGKMVAASTLPGKVLPGKAQILLHLWDVAGGTERILHEDIRHHEQLEFSPDGKFLAAASGTYGLRVWDTATAKLLYHLNVETGCIAFSPDSKMLVSANYDWTLKLWDVPTGKEQATLRAAAKRDVQRLAFSPNGKLLGEAGQRGIRIWDVAAGKVVQELPERMVYEIAFAPDGKLLAASGGSNIRLWEVATGKRLGFRDGHFGEVESVTPSPNGKILVSTSYSDGTLCLWDIATGKLLHQPPGAEIAGRAASLSADGKFVASGGHDGFVHLWDATTGKEHRKFPIEASGPEQIAAFIDAVRLSPDGKRLAAVARFDERASLQIMDWEVATGKLLARRPFKWYPGQTLTPDGKGMTVHTPDGLAIQDTSTGKNLVTFTGIVDLVPIAFSPDGKLAALTIRSAIVQGTGKAAGVAQAASGRTAVGIADATTGMELLRIQTGDTYRLAFSPDGRLLAAIDHNLLRLWELASGKEVYRRSRHEALPGVPAQAAFTSVAILPGNRALATGLMDGTILVWDLNEKTTAGGKQERPALDSWWADLAGDDARTAYHASQSMERFAARTSAYLNEQLGPAAKIDPAPIKQLIADLDSEEFAVRRKAGNELEKQGPEVEPVFRGVLAANPSPEVRKRLESLLSRSPLPLRSGESLRQVRAVAVLERIDSPESRALLQKLAGGTPEARLTREAKASLERLNRNQPEK